MNDSNRDLHVRNLFHNRNSITDMRNRFEKRQKEIEEITQKDLEMMDEIYRKLQDFQHADLLITDRRVLKIVKEDNAIEMHTEDIETNAKDIARGMGLFKITPAANEKKGKLRVERSHDLVRLIENKEYPGNEMQALKQWLIGYDLFDDHQKIMYAAQTEVFLSEIFAWIVENFDK